MDSVAARRCSHFVRQKFHSFLDTTFLPFYTKSYQFLRDPNATSQFAHDARKQLSQLTGVGANPWPGCKSATEAANTTSIPFILCPTISCYCSKSDCMSKGVTTEWSCTNLQVTHGRLTQAPCVASTGSWYHSSQIRWRGLKAKHSRLGMCGTLGFYS